MSLNLLDSYNYYFPVDEPGQASFSLDGDQIVLTLNNNFGTGYESPEATYFGSTRPYYLQVDASDSKTGSYALSINLIDDYADRIALVNGVMTCALPIESLW